MRKFFKDSPGAKAIETLIKRDVKRSSHYSAALNPEIMIAWAKFEAIEIRKALKIAKRIEKGTIPILVYRGMSGINHAAYLSAALFQTKVKFEQIYVRKEQESAHGYKTEVSVRCQTHPCFLVFVDDFICSGTTLKETLKEVLIKTYFFHNVGPSLVFLSLFREANEWESGIKRKSKTGLERIQKFLVS